MQFLHRRSRAPWRRRESSLPSSAPLAQPAIPGQSATWIRVASRRSISFRQALSMAAEEEAWWTAAADHQVIRATQLSALRAGALARAASPGSVPAALLASAARELAFRAPASAAQLIPREWSPILFS